MSTGSELSPVFGPILLQFVRPQPAPNVRSPGAVGLPRRRLLLTKRLLKNELSPFVPPPPPPPPHDDRLAYIILRRRSGSSANTKTPLNLDSAKQRRPLPAYSCMFDFRLRQPCRCGC
ncbi:hypothetical protein MY11210_007495 [Beauveria gryllotalpidicola]